MPGRGSAALLAAAVAGGAAALLATRAVAWLRSPPPRDGYAGADAEAKALTAALHATIPLSRAMALRCAAFPQRDAEALQLVAPFVENNRNVHGSAFAGSVYAAAVLCGWAWAEAHAQRSGGALARATLVVRAAAIRYRAPLRDTFTCIALPPGAAALARFAADFAQHGKATLCLRVAVWTQADAAAGAALAQADAEAAGTSAGEQGAIPPAIATPDGRKPACILDGEFTAFVPA
jgi:thioesterase domain-containing protein